MIPTFPEFKKIEISDREEVFGVTQKFPLYSDFNFTSMWSWDVRWQMGLSKINGNLAVKFTDYLNGIPFYSFLGDTLVDVTIDALIDLSLKEGLEPQLKLVPEISITSTDKTKFVIEESMDHFDYILDNEILMEYKGRALHNHANFKRRFVQGYNSTLRTEILNIDDPQIQEQMKTLNKLWTHNKVDQEKKIFPGLEEEANKRFFGLDKNGKTFVSIGIFQNNELIAFTVDEIIGTNFSIRHFMKGNIGFKGVYSYLISESARVLLTQYNVKCTNIEQDLGLMNLRQSKKSFAPVLFLKKYTVSPLAISLMMYNNAK